MPNRPTRRTFLKLSAAATPLIGANVLHAFPANVSIALIIDNGALISAEPVQWAVAELRRALQDHDQHLIKTVQRRGYRYEAALLI